MTPDMRKVLKSQLLFNWAKDNIYRSGVTQRLTFGRQLEAGIRYFDLRIARLDDRILFVHGLYGDLVYPAMVEIRDYLKRYTSEVVVLDFQHMYDLDTEQADRVLAHLVQIFAGMLQRWTRLRGLSPQGMVARGKHVILMWPTGFRGQPDVWTRAVDNRYVNTHRPSTLITRLDAYALHSPQSVLHVTQLILSVDDHLGDGSLRTLTEGHESELRQYVMLAKRFFNVVICDFVDAEFSQIVLRRNLY